MDHKAKLSTIDHRHKFFNVSCSERINIPFNSAYVIINHYPLLSTIVKHEIPRNQPPILHSWLKLCQEISVRLVPCAFTGGELHVFHVDPEPLKKFHAPMYS